MKHLLKSCLATLVAFTLFTACETSDSNVEPQITLEFYNDLSTTLENDFASFGSSLRAQESIDVISAGKMQYGAETAAFEVFKQAYRGNILTNGKVSEEAQLSIVQKTEVEAILASINNYSSFSEFNQYLDSKFIAYHASDLSQADKTFLMTYVTLYRSSLDFVYNNQDLFVQNPANGKVVGWWDDWGKCAASIAGGAITGATTLGLAGAAVGTVVLPVVGTVSAGAVGAIGGGIGGALTGAAAGC